jgi:hypothetical protein
MVPLAYAYANLLFPNKALRRPAENFKKKRAGKRTQKTRSGPAATTLLVFYFEDGIKETFSSKNYCF